MENEKLENQKIGENKMEDVAGGYRNNTQEEAPVIIGVLYVDGEEYGALLKSGLIGEDRRLHEHDVKKAMGVLFSTNGYNSLKVDSERDLAKAFSKIHSIEKPRKIAIDVIQ